MNSKTVLAELKQQTNDWVESLVPRDYIGRLQMPRQGDVKVIRDSVSDYQILEPYEYLVLDHPVMQRLRCIHQTALAYLVYPSANHTRFDHSLGCAKIAKRIGEHVIPGEKARIAELSLAALLHDVGHTFFSHLSETVMESQFREQYFALKNATLFRGLDLKLSEIMSYLIVTSEHFRAFLDKVIQRYLPVIDLDNVSRLLLHRPRNEWAFMADIVSGPFDADKLDYLVRDCYFTGIRADVDVERVEISTAVLDPVRFPADNPKWKRRSLVMLSGGVNILEQVTFNKMLLFPAIYHHHKVRAIECMVKSIFESIWDEPGRITDERLRFRRIIDFYRLTDPEFTTLAMAEDALRPLVQRLLSRDLLKRCLVLSPRYVQDGAGWKHLSKRHYEDSPEEIRWLRDLILQELPGRLRGRVKVCDIWVDIPKLPPLGDPDRAFVDIGTGELLPLSEFFPYPHWISAYETNKLKGHVFCISDSDTRLAVNTASQKAFRDEFGLVFDPRATQECKLQ